MTTHIFTEAIDLTEAQIDTDNRVLRDVVLIRAGESANKRDYPAAVLQASAPIFEGVKAYADHPTRTDMKERSERSIRDITGWYANVRYEGERLVADRHFAPTQAGNDAWALAEMVATGKAPKTLAGLSINAVGRARKRDDGGMVVESITAAESVDDVTTPAAGGSYLEAAAQYDLAQAFYEALDYDEWLTIREDFTARYDTEHRKVRWNAELKEAKATISEYAARVQELEAENSTLTEQRDAAVDTAQLAERKVRVIETLDKVSIPVRWKESLRTTLLEAAPETWLSIIQAEISKAKSAGHKPQVAVNVPGPQESRTPPVQVTESMAPRDDETPQQWYDRIQRLKQG